MMAFHEIRGDDQRPGKSPYLAFADLDYVFTVEAVKPGIFIFNFVCLAGGESNLSAKQIRLTLENRRVPVRFFAVDTGDEKDAVPVPALRMRSRSSFGVRLEGDFGKERELLGAIIRVGNEDFSLVPLSSFDFENLVLKVNRLNLGSPDFRDDWRVLKLEALGTRGPASRSR
jgi:hypothetical protein